MSISTNMPQTAAAPPRPDVLVVDDNPAVTRALAAFLKDAGYRPGACHSAREAMDYMAGHEPVAAVLDIHLPDMSGLNLSRWVRERLGPAKPIIVLSGDTSMDNLRALPSAGATFFMGKPFRPEHLVARLNELVAGEP